LTIKRVQAAFASKALGVFRPSAGDGERSNLSPRAKFLISVFTSCANNKTYETGPRCSSEGRMLFT
ncbi:MAG TPA: hypothetical protein PKW29_03615, partial [Clostridia bacterium]|nr:hypothetical protein [Clostridia bacterium]